MYYRTTKLKPIDVKTSIYIYITFEHNNKNSKFKFRYHVRISKYKSIFDKIYAPNGSEECFTY